MSYHIVSIDAPQCSISCRDGQLVCKTDKAERKLPLEDVASVVVTSFSASLHSHLIIEAAKHGVALIICEAFKPVSVVLPANRSTDTLLTRAILKLSDRTRETLWQKTVDAKCQNQLCLAEHVRKTIPHSAGENQTPVASPPAEQLNGKLQMLRATAFGKKPHKEAICAKTYWQILGRSLSEEEFVRDRASGGLNSLLNYGYAVLLSTVLQKLFAVGLDPTFGISHVARERSTPLAYDLMEPFRPCVDWRVVQWARKCAEQNLPLEVTKEFRGWVTGFVIEKVEYMEFSLEIQGCIEGMVRGFRRAVLSNQPRLYKPWTPKNSKWVG